MKKFIYSFFITVLFGIIAQAQTQGIAFQAIVSTPQGNLLNVSNITVNAKILSPNGCILREEEFTNFNITNGYLYLSLTQGTATGDDPGFNLQKIFNNSAPLTGLTCINNDGTIKVATTTYAPTLSDIRKVRVSFQNNSDQIVADFNMRTVPFSVNAENLNGKKSTDFVAINNDKNVTQEKIETIFQDYVKLTSLLSFDPADFVRESSNSTLQIPSVSAPPSLLEGQIWYEAGVIKYYDGATVQSLHTASGSSDLNATQIRGKNVSTTTPISGQVLKFDGTNWSPVNFGIDDLLTSTGASQFASANCTASQTLTWSAVTDAFTCANILGLNASAISAGTLDADRLPASVKYWLDGGSNNIYYNAGNVGIGTDTPVEKVEVNGRILADSLKLKWSVKTATNTGDTLTLGQNIFLDASVSSFNLVLPANATQGEVIKFVHAKGNIQTNKVTLTPGAGDTVVEDSNLVLDMNNISIDLIFFDPDGDGSGDWRLY